MQLLIWPRKWLKYVEDKRMNKQDKKTKFTHRFLARVEIEAVTPLVIGTGAGNVMTNAVVVTDANGLPYIPGTTLAGIIRHALGEDVAKDFFGFKDASKGSEIIFSEARMVGKEGEVLDGMAEFSWDDEFYDHFRHLPIHQHVRIDEKGIARKGGKFDEQVVFKGTRFCFEIEMVAVEEKDKLFFNSVLHKLSADTFRIGSGTRNGFGEIKIVCENCRVVYWDLSCEAGLNAYLNKSSDLSKKWNWGDKWPKSEDKDTEDWKECVLTLTPDNFFLFGSGYGDKNADMTPVEEIFIDWSSGRPEFKIHNMLMPVTSVKGALSHRVAFYWNKLEKRFAGGKDKDKQPLVGKENPAVLALFGSEGELEEKEEDKMKNQCRGNVIFSVVAKQLPQEKLKTKILNHVSIDRFTGGAMAGALFSEEVVCGVGQEFELKLLINTKVLNNSIKEALRCALEDLCTGMLPLGGGVNRGNGCFTGNVTKGEDVLLYTTGV